MKRLLSLALTLCFIFALSGCIAVAPEEKIAAVPETKDTLKEPSPSFEDSVPPNSLPELPVTPNQPVGRPGDGDCTPSPIPAPDVVTVVKIVNTATPDLDFAQALEKVYEDKSATYYFSCIMSGYIIVHYSDGTQEDIKTALNEGILTIEEAKSHGIRFIEESKNLVEY